MELPHRASNPPIRDLDAGVDMARRLSWARDSIPGFKLVDKAVSPLMKFVYYSSLMFLWNKRFMTEYTTTVGSTIYFARPLRGIDGFALFEHEVQHILDSKKFGRIGWALLYLFPQSLALLALLAVVSPWFLLALLALAPWPAPFRVWAEKRGYRVTFVVLLKYGQPVVTSRALDWMESVFCGWPYYKMSWRKQAIRDHFKAELMLARALPDLEERFARLSR